MQGSARTKKKKKKKKKIRKLKKKLSPKASDTVKGSYHHNRPDLWGRGCQTRSKDEIDIKSYVLATLVNDRGDRMPRRVLNSPDKRFRVQ